MIANDSLFILYLLMYILRSFLLQTVDLVDISILNHCQKHTIFIVIILDLNKDMTLIEITILNVSPDDRPSCCHSHI